MTEAHWNFLQSVQHHQHHLFQVFTQCNEGTLVGYTNGAPIQGGRLSAVSVKEDWGYNWVVLLSAPLLKDEKFVTCSKKVDRLLKFNQVEQHRGYCSHGRVWDPQSGKKWL